ncbi:MAG: DUF177 domain-containing protein [Bacteroidetes bacterium]|nr:DUF177 domain-containing protein [Bacteroidota bacterium]
METAYAIPFKGLGVGQHHFTFEIDATFFEKFDFQDIKSGSAKVLLDLTRESALMDMHFNIKGTFEVTCDRCLGNYMQPIEGEFRLIVKFGDDYEEESDEVVIIPKTESRIDLSQYIYEYVNLLLPIQRKHPNIEDCDPEMIEKINKHSKPEVDPRWEKLKNIKLK